MWAGTLSAHHVVVLAENLVLNARSRVFAIRGGTPELQGWDAHTVIAARTHNLIAGLIAGLSRNTDLDALLIAYPAAAQHKHEPEAAEQTLADFIRTHIDTGRMEEFMYGKG